MQKQIVINELDVIDTRLKNMQTRMGQFRNTVETRYYTNDRMSQPASEKFTKICYMMLELDLAVEQFVD